jgi:hypothetical protein
LENLFGRSGWEADYTVISTVQTVADINRASVLSADESAIVGKVLDLKLISRGAPYEFLPVQQPILANKTRENVKQYLALYPRLAIKHIGIFLQSRYRIFNILVTNAGWFDEWKQNQNQLMNLRILPLDFNGGMMSKGLRGATKLQSYAEKFCSSLYIQVIISFVACIIYLRRTECMGIALCLISKVVVVFLMTPVPSSNYLYDVYLTGIFLALVILNDIYRAIFTSKYLMRRDF